ncbi:MAG TPA: choice-of-anchor tandem repeat GloVer-containing protein [Bacteroidia bacterium]|jgi:uncharacterized repeat protein (TIGR03803 family)|nr:choice-of-anchor tandem repeat GloVer-containing protein [Bacteroidia bacterium]
MKHNALTSSFKRTKKLTSKTAGILAMSVVLFASCKKNDTTPTTTTPVTTPTVTPGGGTFTTLYNFKDTNGANPDGDLIMYNGVLYGMTNGDGVNYWGNIFSINPNGTGYKDLHDFPNNLTDGSQPFGDLTASGGLLYGMTYQGGANQGGTIFSIKPDGSAYTTLRNFGATNNDAYHPLGNLVIVGSTMYGASSQGGVNGLGNIFSISTTGTNYMDLYDFNSPGGIEPECSPILSGTVFYGTAYLGGPDNDGIVYSYDMSTKVFTTLVNFGGARGQNPDGGLVLIGDNLQGMTNAGGNDSVGTIYTVNVDGSGFTTLLSFNGINGAGPYGNLILNGNMVYGMTTGGGTGGVLFSMGTNGSSYTDLVNFGLSATPGAFPHGSLLLSNNVLYGMTNAGGKYSYGTIFSYSL